MDATKAKRKSVRRSLNKELKNDVDIISSLPDHILHHILSFLCTKLAVATCVLSRRWKYLWRSVHTLDFSYDYYFSKEFEYSRLLYDERTGRKKNFVDRMLLRHDMSDIQTFSYNGACDSYSLHSWIFTLIRHDVRKLFLSLQNEMDDPIVLPSSFFSCESLTLLDIDAFERDIKIPTLVSFPSLKILRLQNISFIQKELTHQVLFSCPKLEGLGLLDINWQNISTVQIKTPQLKNLVISDTDSNFSHDVVIEIYAESLISLELKSIFLYKYCLYNLFSLDIAIIDTWEYTDGEQYHYVDLLRGISNVKDLTLGLKSIEVLSCLDLSAYLLTFSSLTHLSIDVTPDVDLSDTIGTNLVDVLCKTPNIESLRFLDGIYGCRFKKLGLTVETNPVCFLPHLKVIDYGWFADEKNELCLIDFFLKNVRALQKMNVEIHQRLREEERIKIARHLRQLARHSNGVLEYFL